MSLTTRILTPLAFAMGVGSISSPAEARPDLDRSERFRKPRFERRQVACAGRMDKDCNGLVTWNELQRFHRKEARASARRIDRDGDRWLSPWELRRDQAFGPRQEWGDLDGDGLVTRAERRTMRRALRRGGVSVERLFALERREARRRFEWLDRNHDGVLQRFEVRQAYARFDDPRPRPRRWN